MKFDVKTINRRYQARKRLEGFKAVLKKETRTAQKFELIELKTN